jgi:hypothetical protein
MRGNHVRLWIFLALVLFLFVACSDETSTLTQQPEKKSTEEIDKQPVQGSKEQDERAASNQETTSQGKLPTQGATSLGVASTPADKRGRPNIIFILTDDLDYRPGSISHMPNLQRYLVDRGPPSITPS